MASKQKIAIIGAGGFGLEVLHFLDKNLYECVGFIDYEDIEKLPVPIIGHENNMAELINRYKFSNCILALGDMSKRKKIYKHLKNFTVEFPTIVDSSVKCFSKAIQQGVILYPGVIIMNDCQIGKFTLLNTAVTLGHDVIVGDFCNINPGVNLAGRITIGNGSLIGIGASIKENITIGENAIIGAGSVVLNDVPDNTVVYGVPAKEVNS